MPDSRARVLIAGVSTRAAAESAARAGFRVTAIDAFGDLDQHPGVDARAVSGRFSARSAVRAARDVECDAVAYLSSFENHPAAVRALAAGRTLWGNPPDVLRRVRDPFVLAGTLSRCGFEVPALSSAGSDAASKPGTTWLLKPRASGGGRRVRRWQPDARAGLPRDHYLQEHVDGRSASVVFAAANGRAVPLAVSWQLVGEPVFGASGYQYCGSILASAAETSIAPGDRLVGKASALSHTIAAEFGLAGVNCVDFIARDDRALAIEVNPRWSASMELVEHAYGLSMFGAHAAACAGGELPRFDLSSAQRDAAIIGKAVVFARHDVAIGDTRAWLPQPGRPAPPISRALPDQPDPPAFEIRDVPRPGARIAAGSPVCTVLAAGRDYASCHAALVRAGQRVYAALAAWQLETA